MSFFASKSDRERRLKSLFDTILSKLLEISWTRWRRCNKVRETRSAIAFLIFNLVIQQFEFYFATNND